MGKHKKPHSQYHGSRGDTSRADPRAGKKMGAFSRVSTRAKLQAKQKPQDKNDQKHRLQQNQRPVVPFLPSDRILLAGEGDFSFALSLASSHGCRRMLATCYDSKDILYQKYPPAEQHITQLCSAAEYTGSARGLKRKREGTPASENGSGSNGESTQPTAGIQSTPDLPSPKVLFSIDAKKLGLTGGGGKVVRKGFPRLTRKIRGQPHKHSKPEAGKSREIDESGPWDIICFNFPHVGGLSTDVNRQVRANQELLVSFFKACVPLLSAPPLDDDGNDWEEEDEGLSDASDSGENPSKSRKLRSEPGQVIVTLFEGEPYTLWNIRDLARHAGLRVVTSFKFPWGSYPGYSHSRTLGEIEGKDGERGGWRGEEREARSYVFERKEFEDRAKVAGKRTRKRKNESDDSDDD
ncbi:25S rRNA (uracil2634-N3)-methyltransferase [Coccidioides immitis RS]|uniref:25S rRNA (uridine-N(3))-methyltransferase BMT5-like domain-containing protein n=2 Tax=Coccidioides immitis TaxID=5501 RepID=J3K816_COCIM|nr:25S rRNA (uracil2634-N3)-methyltransferase [Coccidioides immitis RS]EAS30899.3 hypothetical protein CIMG_06378 [Coccidioides immitis RS]KMP03487.1 conserved eukaryotic protein [Coccidioides immitis RMSCC 2394]TPX23777.1 hypothetical protein DIZ76_013116 [Coccidioides immitis]